MENQVQLISSKRGKIKIIRNYRYNISCNFESRLLEMLVLQILKLYGSYDYINKIQRDQKVSWRTQSQR